MNMQWIATTPDIRWQEQTWQDRPAVADTLIVTATADQVIDGFGGCFNELGWIALGHLDPAEQSRVLADLFDPTAGSGLTFCRLPIGASDYAAQWYSLDEFEGDIELTHFSIERDRRYLIPYIKAAQDFNPQLRFFASPWSPPAWMKQPPVYNYGRLRMEPEILASYARYFEKYITAYQAEGIPISQVHVQNEPFADQKFPSCLWSPEQFRVFIRDYLGPRLAASGLATELWLGTLNGPTQMHFSPTGRIDINLYDRFVDDLLFDPDVRQYLRGVGYQWAGQHIIARTRESFPELGLMQTENECGDGNNTWVYAQYVFNLMRHYLGNGVSSYIYWNMILEPQGRSTWGWTQNALITIDPLTRRAIYNPEFYVLKHLARFVAPGARRLQTRGHWTGSSLAFANPDGSVVVVMSNALSRERAATLQIADQAYTVNLAADSFNTFVFRT